MIARQVAASLEVEAKTAHQPDVRQQELRQPARTLRHQNAGAVERAGNTAAKGPRVIVDELNIGFDPAQLRRCPSCGGMVYRWPCLACAMTARG